MVDSLPVAVLVGTVLGFLAGIGVGGGSLLILWLTMVLGMAPETARSINLMFFLPSAAVACCFRWKQGVLKPGQLLPGIAAGCIASVIGTKLSTLADPGLLRKLFGVLLIFTAIRELSYQKKPGS